MKLRTITGGRGRLAVMGGIAGAIIIPLTAMAQDDGSGPATLADITRLENSINFAWALIAAFLVFFMQAGFAMVEAGFARRRNTVNILSKNFMDFCIAGLAFWAFGFAIMFGGSGGAGLGDGNDWFGLSGFFLAGDAYDAGTMELWMFQMVFAATAATIVSGAMSERTKINAYLAYSFLISAIVYPVFGHWMWGGGWLSTVNFGVGARDFAGSGVVHAIGGISALIGAALVGPRMGKFGPDGKARVLPGHNIPYVIIGTFILFFGWFGFNPGSTLAATDDRIAAIAVMTFLAGIAGGVVGFYWSFSRTGKADIGIAANGTLAGLVGITAPCAYVAPWAALVIGAIGAGVMLASLSFVENVLKIDDPVGASSVHGAAGLWGLLAVGLFADGTYGVKGLFYGDGGQLIAQLIAIVTVVVWGGLASGAIFLMLKNSMGLRVSREEEIAGLDVTEHGLLAYPDDETYEDAAPASGRRAPVGATPGLAGSD